MRGVGASRVTADHTGNTDLGTNLIRVIYVIRGLHQTENLRETDVGYRARADLLFLPRLAGARATLFHVLVAATRDGLDHSRIDGGNEVEGGVEVFFRHAGFQRPLDASVGSRLTTATHRDRQANEHFLALGQAGACLGLVEITTKRIWFTHVQLLFQCLQPPRRIIRIPAA